jgi:hypothetical protein
MRIRARSAFLSLVAFGLVIGLVSTFRLAAVVAATPTAQVFDEPLMLIDPDVVVEWDASARAEAIASRIGDPSLFRARLHSCQFDPDTYEVDFDICLSAVDDALRAAPSSGELWLYKAQMLAASGEFGPALFAALRNSYRMAPHEGWIATPRVIFGLRVYPLLPEDVKSDVQADLVQIIGDGRLSHIVARAYAEDPSLRDAGGAALRTLPSDLMFRFAGITREAAADIAAGQ